MQVSWDNGYKNTGQVSLRKACVRTWKSSLFRLTVSDSKLCPALSSLSSESTKCPFIYQETPKVDGSPSQLLCVLSPWPPTWFEWSLSNPDCFESQRWGNDNILSFLWIFHFIPAEAKPHHVGQISVFMGLNRRSEGMCFNFHLQFNYSLHGSLERPSLPTLCYLPGHQENRAASCSARCLELYSFLRP